MMPKKHVKHKTFLMFLNLEHENSLLLLINNNNDLSGQKCMLIMLKYNHTVTSESPKLKLPVERQELCQLQYSSQIHAFFHVWWLPI